MSGPDRWYHHVPPATGVIPCDGAQHRVTWRWGKVKLEDHDLGSERAMLVLGGEPAACLRALGLWGSQFGMPPDHFARMDKWLGADAALAPKELALPREVGMTLSWERSWKLSAYRDKHGKVLERQLRDRALPLLRAHLTQAKQEFGCRIVRSVELRHVPAGREPPSLFGTMDSVSVSARVTLSSDWIVRVWARGLGAVDGAFVLDVTGPGSEPGSAAVQAVRWARTRAGVAEPARVAADAVPSEGGWRLVQRTNQ